MANKQDLRVIKTKEAIHRTFKEMILEMKYEEISVKELCLRAKINRKTFYTYYTDLDHLLETFQNQVAEEFGKRVQHLQFPDDISAIVKEFFMFNAIHNPLYEHIMCSGNYRMISDNISQKILSQMEQFHSLTPLQQAKQNLLFCFVFSSTIETYRQWVSDGKVLSLETVIQFMNDCLTKGILHNNFEL